MEGGGIGVTDSSGNGRHGTLANGSWVIGPQGPMISFNNTSTVINGPNIPSSNTMWWMFRCTPNTVTGIHAIANKYVTSGTSRSWRIHQSATDFQLQISSDGVGNEQQACQIGILQDTLQTFLLAFNAGQFRAWRRREPTETVQESTISANFTATSLFNNTTAVNIGTGNAWFSGTMNFFAMGTGVISNALAVDMLRHPFADFETVDPDYFVPDIALIGGGNPLSGAFGTLGGVL